MNPTNPASSMIITELQIANTKRIVAFHLGFDHDNKPVVLTGDNGQGKSSVLDAILLALTNSGLEDPIRRGASTAKIKLVIHGEEGEYTIERRITRSSRSITIKGADGKPIPSPQAFLDGLTGSLAFDPLAFVGMKPKMQAVAIRDLVGLDTSALDAEYKTLFARRTEVNRQLGDAQAVLKNITKPEVPAEVEEKEVLVSELVAERDVMIEKSQAADSANRVVDNTWNAVEEAGKRVLHLEAELLKTKEQVEWLKKEHAEAVGRAEAYSDRAPTAEAIKAKNAEIAAIDQTNAAIRARREARANALRQAEVYEAKQKAAKTVEANANKLTVQLDAIKDKIAKQVAEVKMPVEGMTYDEDGVMIDGMRFDQLSSAQQIRISAAVAMASNPKLKIILIREGALMNKTHRAALYSLAAERGYQVWVEVFQETPGSEGLHIEDGNVTHIDGEPVGEAAPAPEPEPAPEAKSKQGDMLL